MTNPQFPLYIVSKGRADSRLTSKALEKMNTPYQIVIENQEYKQYADVIDKKKILVLDKKYQEEYDTFDDFGNTKPVGAGAVRNFIWDHSISEGHKWHWVMDDNIRQFYRYNDNRQIVVSNGTIFKCMEDFVLRYNNIAMAGPQYFMFVSRKSKNPPFIPNTRIFSCNLIKNEVPFRWRGRYNEDVDLSIRMLKEGYSTILFNAFLQMKMTTLTVKGGNTEALYANGANKLMKSKMIVNMHPDVVRLAYRYGRAHHHTDLSKFRNNRLGKIKDLVIPNKINNYGMEIKTVIKKT